MDSPHAASLVQMREASLGQLAPQFVQSLVAVTSHSPPIRVRPLLLFRLPLALPVPPAPLRFRNVTPDFLIVHFFQDGAAMIALISHHLFLDSRFPPPAPTPSDIRCSLARCPAARCSSGQH